MFGLSAAVRVYLATEPADMRKSFDGLAALASSNLALDPLSGHLFVFINKRRDRIKVLYWDRDGMAVWAKRLEHAILRVGQDRENVVRELAGVRKITYPHLPGCPGRDAG